MDAPKRLRISFDVGTTTCGGCAQWEDQDEMIPIEFETGGKYAFTPELHACLAYVMKTGQWIVGNQCCVLSGAIKINHLKVGIMGQNPYHQNLTSACKVIDNIERARTARLTATSQSSSVKPAVSPVYMLQQLLQYMLRTLEAQLCRSHDGFRGGGETMKISLVTAATAEGLTVRGTSEALAAAYYAVNSPKHLPTVGGDDATLIVDVGGGTIDVAAVQTDHGKVALACGTDGVFGGGEMVTRGLLRWLIQRNHVKQEDISHEKDYLIAQIEDCKQQFRVGCDMTIVTRSGPVDIKWEVMHTFFDYLATAGAQLLRSQMKKISGRIGNIYVLGASFRNYAFFQMFCDKLPDLRVIRIAELNAVALGALYFARAPIHENSVATRFVGLTYDDAYSPMNKRYPFGRVTKSIGWVISEANPCEEKRTVTYEKQFFEDMDDKNFLITIEVVATTDRFDLKNIKPNKRITWNCPVTLLAENHKDSLEQIGLIEAYISKQDVFPVEPSSSEQRQSWETFDASIWKVNDTLHTEVLHKGKRLNFTFFPAAAMWMPESEFQFEHHQRKTLRPQLKEPKVPMAQQSQSNNVPLRPRPILTPSHRAPQRVQKFQQGTGQLHKGSRGPRPNVPPLMQLQQGIARPVSISLPPTPRSSVSDQRLF